MTWTGGGKALLATLPYFNEGCLNLDNSMFPSMDTRGPAKLILLLAPLLTPTSDSTAGGEEDTSFWKGLETLVRASTPTIPPMVRAPFTNLFPDFVVFGENVDSLGWGGVDAAGMFDSNWRVGVGSFFKDLASK